MNRRPRSPQFKSQVALEALKNQKTVNELAAEYEIHQTQIGKWKKQLLGMVQKAAFLGNTGIVVSSPVGIPICYRVRKVGVAQALFLKRSKPSRSSQWSCSFPVRSSAGLLPTRSGRSLRINRR